MRKFVQLVSHEGVLYAVADDGTAWGWREKEGWKWHPVLDLPQPQPVKVRERDV